MIARMLRLLPLLLLATPLLAESADLQLVATEVPAAVRAGDHVYIVVGVRNNGPDIASSYTLDVPESSFPVTSGPCAAGCTHTRLFPGSQETLFYEIQAPLTDGTVTLHLSVTSPSDPDPSNNSLTISVPVSTAPDLLIYDVEVPSRLDAGGTAEVFVTYRNYSRTPAHDVVVDVDFPEGAAIVEARQSCTTAGTHATCAVGTVEYLAFLDLRFLIVEPQRPGIDAVVRATIHGPEPEFNAANNHAQAATQLFRELVVANTGDSGTGSLRQAILSGNATCTDTFPCKIRFAIDGDGAWKTIRPLTPLPPVTAMEMYIDGATQTARGETNADGPEIEINGSQVSEGDGLVVQTVCNSEITGLAINGFPGNGLVLDTARICDGSAIREVWGNYLGTDPTGRTAVPNGLRGVSSTFADGSKREDGYLIKANVLSGNGRSGLFIWRGRWYVRANRIGVAAHEDRPLGNGASGVFIGTQATGTDVIGNVIAYNGEAGIARAGGASENNLEGNFIYRNGGLGIDYNIDGVSLTVPSVRGSMDLPVILSARYDAATNKTVVEAVPGGFLGYSISIYASDAPDPSGYGEGQRYLGRISALSGKPVTIGFDGNLTGQWISALGTIAYFPGFAVPGPVSTLVVDDGFIMDSTEFGRAVQVTR